MLGRELSHRVLVVEDDADARSALCDLLQLHGFDCLAAVNGKDALEKLSRTSELPDAILLDLRMPVMDGWEFRAVQKQDARMSSVPVIAISADGTAQAAAVDAATFLNKPFDSSALLQALRKVLRQAQDRESRERALSQARAERLAAIGTLAAGAAHEINNPLAYVSANLGYADEELGDVLARWRPAKAEDLSNLRARLEEVRQAIAESRDGTARVQEIVRGLKAFSRADEQAPGTAVNVAAVLEGAIKIAANEIRHRARLVREYQAVPPVRANAGRLGQVVLNLLMNAVQALPEGDAEHQQITVRALIAPPSRVAIEVEDSGPGIPPELQERIFEPFFTTKPIGVGTGLGLSVCLGIVQSFGGELSVRSEPGRGATFRVLLPVAMEPEVRKRGENAESDPPTRGRILVVDDEPLIGIAVQRALSAEHQVEVTTSAQQALERFGRGERYDLVLCDLMMPQLTGMDLFRLLEQQHPDQGARVVFLTGGAFTERAKTFLESCGRPRLSKPFSLDELRTMVRSELSRTIPRVH